MLSELQVIHEATMTELTSMKKRLNVAEISLTQTNKIRDRLRLELQVMESLFCYAGACRGPSCYLPCCAHQTWAVALNEAKPCVTWKCTGSQVPA